MRDVAMNRDDTTRVLRRTWNRHKSHLPKYTSLPEFQLVPKGRPLFHCRRCGFTNTLIPLCLWCTWTSQEAEHEFDSSTPRARRASAPARVFFQLELSADYRTLRPHDQPKTASHRTSVAPSAMETPICRRKLPVNASRQIAVTDNSTMDDGDPADLLGDAMESRPPALFDVTTATKSLPNHSSVFAQDEEVRPPKSPKIHFRDPVYDPLPSEEEASSVDRSMSAKTSSRTLKASCRLLIIDINDNDTHEQHDINHHDGTNPSSAISPRPQQLRTLRRRKHLNIMQQSISDSATAEPIAISLTLHSNTPRSPAQPTSPSHHRPYSQPHSIATASSDPTTPPLTPTVPTSPTASPVRLGHPSRPYYSAIRKQGVSPPSSRPTSVITPPPILASTTRPQSYAPPSTLPAMSTTASRHMSMSAMFVSPPYSSSPAGVFSAFSVMDDDNDDDEDDDLPMMPPTPHPGRLSFSLSTHRHRLSLGQASTHARTQSHSQSLSQAHSRRASGIGFSMSGETELRMALAVDAASAGVAEDGFRFSETVASTGGGNGIDDLDLDRCNTAKGIGSGPGSRHTFMGRVKKLRKGLKEMLLMNSTTPA